MMVADEERNRFIVEKVVCLHESQGRYVIVLSDRRKHLATLREMLEARVDPEKVGTFAGETTKKGVARREEERKRPILLATVRMAEEGFDEARLDTLVFATPKSNITQCVGRIQRSHPDKQEPMIVDIFDTYCGGAMHGMARARKRFYEDCKFQIINTQ
jgi:superfamily II DNA or RNA helicase